MSQDTTPSAALFVAALTGFVVLGIPFVAYLWETLHQLLSLHLEPLRLLISAALLAMFIGFLAWIGRYYQRRLTR